MISKGLWIWPLLAALGIALTTLVFADLTASIATLIAALVLGFFAAARVQAFWQRRADALAAAAQGLGVEPLDGAANDPHDPVRLAREVKSTALAAQEAARQLAVLRAVVDGMVEGLWITSPDGTIVQHNRALKELLFTGQSLVGQRPLELLRSAELQAAVERACREGTASQLEHSVEGLRPRVLSIHVSPLGRELGGSAAVFFDVTELRHLEKVRKDFVANVSHELRTPITAIRGYAETLQSGALLDPVNAPKMVDIIHRQSERLTELVEDLLELSRIESREIRLASEPVELTETAQRAVDAVRPRAEARNVSIALEISPGTAVTGDRRAIEQILLNLLDNGVKYTRAAGHLWVSALSRGDLVEIRVRDDGAGIEARHLPRLFERFYRVDKGRSRDLGGTGLGLSIVKHLANAMKGEVRVESEPGRGATFVVELPRAGISPAPG